MNRYATLQAFTDSEIAIQPTRFCGLGKLLGVPAAVRNSPPGGFDSVVAERNLNHVKLQIPYGPYWTDDSCWT
jgi:hypothetical protein